MICRRQNISILATFIVVAAAVLTPHASAQTSKPPIIVVSAGQSNDDGRGLLSEWPSSRPLHPDRICTYRFDGNLQCPAAEPVSDSAGSIYPVFNLGGNINDGVGHSLMLADLLQQSHDWTIIVVPCARGGAGWSQWLPSNDISTLYGACKARWQAAVAATGGTILAVEMYGGESDAMVLTDANMVKTRSETIIAHLQQDIPGVAVIYNQIQMPIGDAAKAKFPYAHLVQTKQAAISSPNTTVVLATDDLSTLSDGVHLTTSAQLTVGARDFHALGVLLGWF